MTNPPAATVEADLANLRARVGLFLWNAMGQTWMGNGDARKRIIPESELRSLEAALSPPLTTQAAEPVAWMYTQPWLTDDPTPQFRAERWSTEEGRFTGWAETPLYAAPPSLKTPEQDA